MLLYMEGFMKGRKRKTHFTAVKLKEGSRKVKSEKESESKLAQSCPTLLDPMDCSLPRSSVHGIFQARVLEWGAIAFSALEKQYTANQLHFNKKKEKKNP